MPLRGMVQRFAFVLLVGAALMLLILSKVGNPLVERLRAGIFEVATPVLEILSQPVIAANQLIDAGREMVFLHSENERLREENSRLRQWQEAARSLEQQNTAFKALLSSRPDPTMSFVSARVIGDDGGPFVHTLLVNAGRGDGADIGQAAMTMDGLVGRIIESGRRASRILLLTDLNSRVPVVIEGSRHRAVMEGENTDTMRLGFVSTTAKISLGDRVVTSGHGGVFPPGLPVGLVTHARGGKYRVQPFADYDRLEYVQIIRYRFPTPEPIAAAEAKVTKAPAPSPVGDLEPATPD